MKKSIFWPIKDDEIFCLVDKLIVKVVRTNEAFMSLQEEAEDEVAGDDAAQLDPKNLKVAELRAELEARNLPSKGAKIIFCLRNQLT